MYPMHNTFHHMQREGDARSMTTLVPDSEKASHVYYKRYSWHSKGVGICWGLLTICFLIMNIICFTEPQWIGDSESSPGIGWMGLYEYCELFNSQMNVICKGQFQVTKAFLSDLLPQLVSNFKHASELGL